MTKVFAVLLFTYAACLVSTYGCSSGDCVSGPTVELDLEVTTTLPFGTPPPLSDADVCLDRPVRCGCETTSSAGVATLSVPVRSEIDVAVRRSGFLDTLVQYAVGDTDAAITTRMIRPEELDIVVLAAGERPDPSLGHIGVLLRPSPGSSVAGASFTLHSLEGGGSREALYFLGTAPWPLASSTDSSGAALFVNVPPGRYEIESEAFATCGQIQAGLPRHDSEGNIVTVAVDAQASVVNGAALGQCAVTP